MHATMRAGNVVCLCLLFYVPILFTEASAQRANPIQAWTQIYNYFIYHKLAIDQSAQAGANASKAIERASPSELMAALNQMERSMSEGKISPRGCAVLSRVNKDMKLQGMDYGMAKNSAESYAMRTSQSYNLCKQAHRQDWHIQCAASFGIDQAASRQARIIGMVGIWMYSCGIDPES